MRFPRAVTSFVSLTLGLFYAEPFSIDVFEK